MAHSLFDVSTARIVGTGLRFPEGPVALDDGSVLVSELAGTIARVDRDGETTRYECGGGANGAALGPDGALYVANNGGVLLADEGGLTVIKGRGPGNGNADQGRVQRLDLETGSVDDLYTDVDGQPLGWLNDIVFDAHGSFYVVDSSGGNVHYGNADGSSIRTVASGQSIPNGAGLSPDGTRLYVSHTYTGEVVEWHVASPGNLTGRRVLFGDVEGHGWDGLAVDAAGHICVANLKESGVSVFSPTGEEIARFVTPEHDPWITNICFGGPGMRTAYVCSGGRGVLWSVEWPWPGLRLNFAR